ncbi:hypothetical protein Tco_1400417 [Tanacetum coccineum]
MMEGSLFFPQSTADEHIAVQWNQKARNYLASVYFKARLGGGKAWNPRKHDLTTLKAMPEDEVFNSSSFLRACLHHGSQSSFNLVQAILHLLVPPSASKKMSYTDSPSYSSSTYTAPSNSKTGSHRSGNIEKLDLEEMDLKWQMVMLSVRVHKFEQKAGRKIDFDKKESARFNKKKVRCYKSLQRCHFARECRAKGGNDKQRYSSFKIQEIGKKKEDSKALITIDTLVD